MMISRLRRGAQEPRGGSASYGSDLAASFFSPVNLVGIVGEDFPKEHIELFKKPECGPGRLADRARERPSLLVGEYMWDFRIPAETRSRGAQCFRTFLMPKLPESYKGTPIVLLANIAPDLQHHVLDQGGAAAVR